MKPILFIFAALIAAGSLRADIRTVYTDSPVQATQQLHRRDHRSGRVQPDSRNFEHEPRHENQLRNHDRFQERVYPRVHPRSESTPIYYPREQRIVVRGYYSATASVNSFAPTYAPGGWKTGPWYRSSPRVVTPRNDISDGRSAEQLQSIYGDQSSLFRR